MKKVLLIVLTTSLLCYSLHVSFLYFRQTLFIIFADEQIRIFHLMQNEIYQSKDPYDMAVKLNYIVSYYPSGTKQEKGSRLDCIVETVRKNVTSDVINFLKRSTGKDFGSDAQQWINKLQETQIKPPTQAE